MPTLFRLFIVLLFLSGLTYAGMYALAVLVEPTPEPVTLRLPARELMGEPEPDGRGVTGSGGLPRPLIESAVGSAKT